MAGMLKLSDQDLKKKKKKLTTMLKNLMKKVGGMQLRWTMKADRKILRKIKKKEVLEVKCTVTEMKSSSDGPIRALIMAEERISELEDISTETAKLTSKEESHQK